MSEILNLEAIEQQRILITVSLTGSDGAPVSPSDYVICAAAIGQPNPYTQRAVRKEWAASINNENSAFLLTCPGLDMAGAPWKYRILLKNRALELEWQIVSGRISLTPRACGTDGISPAAYTVACEATPSGLVNVTLDATVGSISETLEQVKASAAAAAAAANNAHADLEDAETAATRASQAALAAAADARIASDKAQAAEAAATAAPEACAPYVQQVQQAAAAALEASRAATTAAAGAQASADAAAPAQGYATRAESAQAAAVQAAETATTAATTATQQAEAATAQAESARLAATTASTAADNAQSAATRAEDAASRAEAAVPAATRAEAARDAAETAAATATTAAADVPGLVTRAETAATSSEAAQTAAETAQSNAETAATTATQQAEAAAASAAQSDTDARACAIYDQRVSANAATATEAATTATEAATTATEAATTATEAAGSIADAELENMVNLCHAIYASSNNADIEYSAPIDKNFYNLRSLFITSSKNSTGDYTGKIVILLKDLNYGWGSSTARVFFAPKLTQINTTGQLLANNYPDKCYVYAPALTFFQFYSAQNYKSVIFGSTFDNLKEAHKIGNSNYAGSIEFASGTTFANLENGSNMLQSSRSTVNLPDTVTFEKLKVGDKMMYNTLFTRLPASMVLSALTTGTEMFAKMYNLEVDDLVRVCGTINDLQSLETPKTGTLGLPAKCKHNGSDVPNTQDYLNANHPTFLTTLAAKGWTVSFA